MNSPHRIMVMADDENIRRQLCLALPPHGYECMIAADADAAVALYRREGPAVVLIDLGFANRHGADFVGNIRKLAATPIILLSEHDDSNVRALEFSCVVRPSEQDELLSRLHEAVRDGLRVVSSTPVFRSGPLTVDLVDRRAFLNGHEIHLSPKEFALLRYLIVQAGRVVTYRQVLEELWGPSSLEDSQYVRVLVRALRRKFHDGAGGQSAHLIATEFGVGYRLVRLPVRT